jgi:mannose/fructose/N-acetylgalactosamine-specific phosphotransferase system component IIC
VEFIGLSALIALFGLDQKHAFQLALSQPLILCSAIGLFLGDFQTAIYFGLFVQLIWLGNLPVGASITPEGNLASAIGCVLYVQFKEGYIPFGQLLLLMVFLYTIIVSYFGGQLDVAMRKFNIRLFNYTISSINDQKKANVGKIAFLALFIQYSVLFIFILLTIHAGNLLFSNISDFFSEEYTPLWQYTNVAIVGVGVGMVMSVYKGRDLKKIILAVSIFGLILFKII